MQTEEILSAGIDIGTSTTQLVFSRMILQNTGGFGRIPQIKVVSKEVIYESEIYFTPLSSREEIDGERVHEIIKKEYEKAGVCPADLATGAVIITGETSRKRNAESVVRAIADVAGEFVVATAGEDLESVLAGKGAGAADLSQKTGKRVVNLDIGGGTTDIAVLSLGGKVKATSVRVAGNHYDEEILKHVRNKYSIAIGQRTAEELKKHVACCPQKTDFHETMEIKGRSLLTGLPVRVNVSTAEPVMMLSEQIGTAAHQVLEKTPPELAGDIYRNGVMLTGGGAQLHGLTEYLAQELKVEVTVSPDPVNCVALGTAMSLGIGDKLETGFTDATPRIGRR